MLELYKAIDDIADFLVSKGIELPELCKRRDPKEPGRTEKEMFEDKLARLIKKRFNTQKEIIAESLRWSLPKKGIDEWMVRIPDLVDPETETKIFKMFVGVMDHGGQIFGENITFDLDWDQYHEDASEWVRKYMYEGKVSSDLANGWLAGLDATTMDALRGQLQNFIEISGYTIGDVVAGLPFDSVRAQRIAITEITRAYGQAQLLGAERLQAEFPNIPVYKTWHTENDDIVCDICGPLNGQRVPAGDMFIDDFGGEHECPPAHVNCRCWMSSRTRI